MSEGIDAYIKKKFEVPDVDIRDLFPTDTGLYRGWCF